MRYVAALLILSITLACSTLAFWTVGMGVWTGKLYYRPHYPPIELRYRPQAFVGLCAFGVLYGCAMLTFGVRMAADLSRTSGPQSKDEPPVPAPSPPHDEEHQTDKS